MVTCKNNVLYFNKALKQEGFRDIVSVHLQELASTLAKSKSRKEEER